MSKILCTLTIEKLHATPTHRTTYKNADLSLIRNTFHDLILSVNTLKMSNRYPLKDIIIHKRFVSEGKATISLPISGVQLLISNSPSHQLKTFLGFLAIKKTKDEINKENKPRNNIRERMLNRNTKGIEEISPITEADIQAVRNLQQGIKRKLHQITPSKAAEKINRKKLCPEDTVPSVKIALTVEQSQVVNAVLAGKSIFFTGSAGTGKSFLLKHIIGKLPPDSTFSTASTGAAACHVGGTTLHAFAGIGTGQALLAQCLEKVIGNKQAVQQWRKCRCLIIDEISMVDGIFFDKMEHIARVVRQNTKPFGGIQLVLCGDFLQLPPVTKPGEKRVFCFQGKSWSNCVKLCMELTEVKRQRDSEFIRILQQIRLGSCPESVEKALKNAEFHNIEEHGVQATRLCTHRDDVDNINRIELEKLKGPIKVFLAEDSEPALSKLLDAQCPVIQRLEFKIGTQVMLTKNVDIQKGLVNGARGVIVSFENSSRGLPVIKFISGLQRSVAPERWNVKLSSGTVITRRQVPLKLAWAMSIHKSQGMTLDCVEISLARVFECGQAYVALSRASSLSGLKIYDFNRSCIKADKDVLKFYTNLRFSKHLFQSELVFKQSK